MNCATLQTWLDRQARVLTDACGPGAADALTKLATIPAARPTSSVAQLCKSLNKMPLNAECSSTSMAEVSKLIELLVTTTDGIAKQADTKDLKQFAALISAARNESLDGFVDQAIETLRAAPKAKRKSGSAPALGDNDVRTYVRRLETALGDDPGFQGVYADILNDKRVKVADAKKIAKLFTGNAGSTKGNALGRIHHRHGASDGFETEGGRRGRAISRLSHAPAGIRILYNCCRSWRA